MRPSRTRVRAALERNLAETHDAILMFTASHALGRADAADLSEGFFAIARQALFNDMIASAMRVFDDHKEAGSLWYIVRCHPQIARRAADEHRIDIGALHRVVPKLGHIRDKTHFHIDRREVERTERVWQEADLSAGELIGALHDAAVLLAAIRQLLEGGPLAQLPSYDGSDVEEIVEALKARRQLP